MRKLFLVECVCNPDKNHQYQIKKHRELVKYIDEAIQKYLKYKN
tara:strand:- start:350 stop:481 length:132 start_codon:yes stop_codon:yes gene_type:complete